MKTFLIIGGLAAAIVVGAVIYQTGFSAKNNLGLTEKKYPSQSDSKEESNADYTGFNSYENPKYHYQIMWRPEWHKQTDNEPPYPPPPQTMNFSRRFSANPPELCDYEISAFDGKDSFQGEIDSLSSKSEYKHESTTIAGSKGEMFTLDNSSQRAQTIYFQHKDAAFQVGYNLMKTKRTLEQCLPVFEKMTASFKFGD